MVKTSHHSSKLVRRYIRKVIKVYKARPPRNGFERKYLKALKRMLKD